MKGKINKGFIHVYTGNGKGKTTAALGLALRAAGAGLNVYIGQFLKKGEYNELFAIEKLQERITLEQFGRERFVSEKIVDEDIQLARQGFQRVKEIMNCERYDVVILDEINVAFSYGLLDVNEVIDFFRTRPKKQELILTGRYAPEGIVDLADLVSEIKAIKHYYDRAVPARQGIEM